VLDSLISMNFPAGVADGIVIVALLPVTMKTCAVSVDKIV
jgi:hypothetical protein